jgi:iron(III) transport system substrate-binding protein
MQSKRWVALASAATLILGAVAVTGAAMAAAPQKLIFYSAQGYDASEATAFQKATGIQVELSDMSTGPLLAKVDAERQNPQWDVIWFDGNEPMANFDAEGMLLKNYDPANLKNYSKLGLSLLPADHAYFPTGLTAAGVIIYSTKSVPAKDAPTTWNSLLKPFFKNGVGMNNPAISGPTYPIVAGIMDQMGTAGGEAFFKGLKANGLLISATNGVTLQALLDGRIKAAIVQDSAARALVQAGDAVKVVYPSTGVVALPSDIAINAKAPDMAAAKEFVNFVLSSEGQKVMQQEKQAGADSLFEPVTKGLIKPIIARGGVKWLYLNATTWGAKEASIVTWFTDNVVR